MQYTIEQFLAAAEQAEVSMIDAQHICDTLAKMYLYRKVTKCIRGHEFETGEIVKYIGYSEAFEMGLYVNIKGIEWWLSDDEHEPTTETF